MRQPISLSDTTHMRRRDAWESDAWRQFSGRWWIRRRRQGHTIVCQETSVLRLDQRWEQAPEHRAPAVLRATNESTVASYARDQDKKRSQSVGQGEDRFPGCPRRRKRCCRGW